MAERVLRSSTEDAPCARAELGVDHSEVAPELEGALEVEPRDRLGALGARHLLRHGLVQVGARRLRHRVIDRVADQSVREAEALLACGVGSEETAAHQVEQAPLRSVALRGRDQAEQVLEQEASADHCRVLEHASLLCVEAIEPGLQDRADGCGRSHAASGFECERRHLLDEQRVALGELTDRVSQFCGSAERVEQSMRVG